NPSCTDRAGYPRKRLVLHLTIELVRCVVQPAALAVRGTRLVKARADLLESGLHALRCKERIFGAIDDQQRSRGNQRGKVWKIQVAVKSSDMKGETNRMDDMPSDLGSKRRHPADIHGDLDP